MPRPRLPVVSVIIPTHNRRASIQRALQALAHQTYPAGDFEVIVVADGCTDDTVPFLESFATPFALRIEQQPGKGAGVARNHGAAVARGSLLVFIDDDIEPTSGFLVGHVEAQGEAPGAAVIGLNPPVLPPPLDFFGLAIRNWWMDQFTAMSRPGHRFSYLDVFTGNLSLPAERFHQIGGFDPDFRSAGGEDWEFGIRLIRAGVPLVYSAAARSWHHENPAFERNLVRACREGESDVLIGRRHPELLRSLRLAVRERPNQPLAWLLRRLAFAAPRTGDSVVAVLLRLMHLTERMRMRRAWRSVSGALRRYWYLRGVAAAVEGEAGLAALLRESRDHGDAGITLDVRDLAAAEARLEKERPVCARILWGEQEIGRIPPHPAAEPLRGAHLRPFLIEHLAWPLFGAVAIERSMPGATRPEAHADTAA